MALGNNNYDNSGTLIGVKVSQKDKEDKKVDPHFVISRKVEDNWVEDSDTYKSISGDIIKIDISEYEWEGLPIKSVKLILKDNEANEAYALTLKGSVLGRDILNKILGLESLENVQIDLYTNKKGYATSSVKQNGELVKWKFDFVDLPKPIEITHPKTGVVISRDYSELDEIFFNGVKEFGEKFEIFGKAKSFKPSSETAKEPTKSESASTSEVEEWD
jgi:hypothetical protein